MKDHLSISQITCYMDCSLKYKFNYIDELPKPFKSAGLAFGSAIHSAIEWFNKKRQSGLNVTLDQLTSLFEADWYAANTENVLYKNGDSKYSMLELGKSLLAVYFKNINGAHVVAVEYPFEVPLIDPATRDKLDLPLVGRVDLVEAGPVIVDFKTAAKRPDTATVDSNLQMTAYAYASYYKTDKIPDLRMDYLVKTKTPQMKKITTSRGLGDFSKLYNLAKEVLKGIKANVFFPNPSWRCNDCEYRQNCFMFNGT